jgi:uncharacterized protein YjbI with pentapeptide repeats
MATKKKAASRIGKLTGKSLAFVGRFFGYGKDELGAMKALVAADGGTVVEADNPTLDILVAGAGVSGNPPSAVAKIQKKLPQVSVIDQAGFYQLVNPTAEEFKEFMLTGPHGHEFWAETNDRLFKANLVIDLSGTDFRNRVIEGTLYKICLDDCDFRGASISAYFDKIKGAKFDGATFNGGSFSQAEDCSLKKVTLNDTRWNPALFVRCDFSGAQLTIPIGSHTTANDCSFKKADLNGADLGESKFAYCDFSGANLVAAKLQKCDFTGANLAGADLSRADLRNGKFENADLRKAKFNDAILSSANLTGATIDGADFTGANLLGTNLTDLDTTKAKNLTPKAARTAGPNMRELAKTASGSKKFQTSIELDLGQDEYVLLTVGLAVYAGRAYTSANYTHHSNDANIGSVGSYVHAPIFEQGMLDLADLWSRGTPKFDTVKVDAKQCPLRGKELQDLAIAAWHEACGLNVPSADAMQKAREQSASEQGSLRDTMLAELNGGAAGIAKWNARALKERMKLGKLRKHDFTNAKLAKANFDNQDLQGCCFDDADLKKANFWQTQLKGASFARADMKEAYLAGGKCSDASFEGATLTNCNLRNASFRRCNFQHADLTASDFSFSDLCGADFSTATLDGVVFMNTKFDEKTQFPPGFVPPEGLDWKGVGVRPGTPAAPPPPKSGTLDFETFLQQMNEKVDQARMQKAGSMLKAERFKLFAEVNDDALVGVVKSQSSSELVYSCRLASDGAFGCCTQNLRPCGGLRGALCKHLLVLIVGLAKAGQIDSATVDHWVNLSRSKKPAIEEESMSATFLRYKGAEAGELDWRPTETIPEDFYTM